MPSCLDTSQPPRPHYNPPLYVSLHLWSTRVSWCSLHCVPGAVLSVYVFSPLSITAQTICARVDGIMRPILYLWIFPPHLSLPLGLLTAHISLKDATIRPQILTLTRLWLVNNSKKGTWLVTPSSDVVWPIIDSDCCSCLPIWPLAPKLQPRTSR